MAVLYLTNPTVQCLTNWSGIPEIMFKRFFVNSPFAFVGIVLEITGAKIPGEICMQTVVIYANCRFE